MQGTITHFNLETNTGHIQAENGQIFRFTLSDITDDIAPAQNMKVSFTESGEQALQGQRRKCHDQRGFGCTTGRNEYRRFCFLPL